MGLFSHEVQREFIARPDGVKGQVVYKWPDENIRVLAQLTVEQDEVAVFFRDGTVVGVLPPGRHTLQGRDIPFLGDLVDAASGGNVLRAELYLVSTREFPSLPFGGSLDTVVDPQTQLAVALRVYGDYSLQVVDPARLIVRLAGTQNLASNDAITDWMRDLLLKTMRQDVVSHISAQGWPILGIAAHTDQIEAETLKQVSDTLTAYGLRIVRVGNFTVSIDDHDAETVKRYREQVQYTRLAGGYQQAAAGEALRGIGDGAATGGAAASPALFGAGLGLAGLVAGGVGTAPAAGAPGRPVIQVRCSSCGAPANETARFCNACGRPIGAVAAALTCSACQAANPPGARFCSGCGGPLMSGERSV